MVGDFNRQIDSEVQLRLVTFVSHELALLVTDFTELLGWRWIGNTFPEIFDVIRDRAGTISATRFAFQHAIFGQLLDPARA